MILSTSYLVLSCVVHGVPLVTQVEMEDSMEPASNGNQQDKNKNKENKEEEEEEETEQETFLKVRDTGGRGGKSGSTDSGAKPSPDVST